MELQVYKARIDPSMDSDLEVNYIGLVDRPAIERNFQAFRDHQKRAAFVLNEEKRIISGAAMIADMPIYRKDAQLGEYYVVFDKLAIQTIVEKFSAKGYLKNFNLFHDQQQKVSDVTIFNSFVSDAELGIPPMAGFEDVADGSWFISAKVNNPTVWEAVKAGTIKGFSVEGLFNYVPASVQKMASSNDLTDDEACFLKDAICNHQATLQAAILIGKDSSLYDLAQSIIAAQTKELDTMKDLLGKGYMPPDIGVEWAMKRIEKIINETKAE
jgi:hypothetical protein